MSKKKKATEAANPINYGKDKELSKEIQLIRVRKSFNDHPKSMRQVATELSEDRSNICWYVGMLRDAGQIQIHHQAKCEVTGHFVNFYTTNKELFNSKKPSQNSLFNMEGFYDE